MNAHQTSAAEKEFLAKIRKAIQVRIKDYLRDNEDNPQAKTLNLTMLRLSP